MARKKKYTKIKGDWYSIETGEKMTEAQVSRLKEYGQIPTEEQEKRLRELRGKAIRKRYNKKNKAGG